MRPGDTYCLAASPSAIEAAVALAAGIRRPASGHVTVAGFDVVASPKLARRHATIVTRRCRFYESCSVRQNVRFFVRSFNSRSPSDVEVQNAMRRVGVPERAFDQQAQHAPSDLALRLWLAIALLRKTSALILDEPTQQLDSRAIGELKEAIGEVRSEGVAVLIATSDLAFAAEIGDRISVVKNGRTTAETTRHDLAGDGLTQFFLEHLGRLPPRSRQAWPRF